MYDPKWDLEIAPRQSDAKFGWRETVAFALVVFSLVFVVVGAVLTASSIFSAAQAAAWAVSALLVVACAICGFCRLLPSACARECTDQSRTTPGVQITFFRNPFLQEDDGRP